MSRRDKSQFAAKRRQVVVPTEQSSDPRGMAKHPIEHRGGSVPRARNQKGGTRRPGR